MNAHERDRELDIVVHGATGFVGRLTAAYLARHHPGAAIGLSGRNAGKLGRLRDELGVGWEVIIADSQDAEQLRTMVARPRVVISCAGPYTRLGEPLAGLCAAAGTHYVDLAGEALFVRDSIDSHHGVAKRTGARLVHSCGFDSVPSDMGMFALHEAAGVPFTEVTMLVTELRGGLSGGTVDSMRAVSAQARSSRGKGRILHHPYTLSPVPEDEPRIAGLEKDFAIRDLGERGWAGPFFMAMYNTRVVRRSNSLLDHAYGERLVYREGWATGAGWPGRLKAWALGAATAGLFRAVQNERLRPVLSRWIPEPGEGPDEKTRRNGRFTVVHRGQTVDGRIFECIVAAQGDPGYEVTAMMLSEAALTLVREADALPGRAGVLTPATGLGRPYLDRLRAGGMRIKVREV